MDHATRTILGIGCLVLKSVGYIKQKDAVFQYVLYCAMGSGASVGLMNLNLARNTIGFYQISKLLCIPTTIVIEYFIFGLKITAPVVNISSSNCSYKT